MEEDKNIRLTLVRQEEGNDEISFDFFLAAKNLKRLFSLWLAAAIAVGALAGGTCILFRDLLSDAEASAVVRFSGSVNMDTLDLQKITSSSVVVSALNTLGISSSRSDDVRMNLRIDGLIPDNVLDRRDLFYSVFNNDSTSGVSAAEQLLSINYTSTRYVLSFDYRNANFTREEGAAILNAVIDAYRDAFMETNTNRPLLGSVNTIIDYSDYDYAEAVGIFDDSLSSIASFLRPYTSDTFRSSTTGYSVSDLLRQAESIQDLELSRLSAFVTQNCVSRESVENVIAHYEWLIEQNLRQLSVQETKLNALISTADGYQKDPLLFFVGDLGTLKGPGGELNGVYDDMVDDILSTQREISRIMERNAFYQNVVDRFREKGVANTAYADRADQEMASLNQRILDLVDLVNQTMDDYFDATLSSMFLVQMPAVAEAPPTLSTSLIKITAAAEVLALLAYVGAAFLLTLGAANAASEKKREAAAREKPHTANSITGQ